MKEDVQLHQDKKLSYHTLSKCLYTQTLSEQNQGKIGFYSSNLPTLNPSLWTSSTNVWLDNGDPRTLPASEDVRDGIAD